MTPATGKVYLMGAGPDDPGLLTVKYDARALAVGQAVLRETGAEDVILFGSRARGDYREDSDIDLLLIHSGPKDYEFRARAKDSAKSMASILYGSPVGVDLIWFSPDEFDRMRRSHNDVSAIASEEGITTDGQSAWAKYSSQSDYSYEYIKTNKRCYYARETLRVMQHVCTDGNDIAGFIVGEYGYQILNHGMKALISASGHRYPHSHDLIEIERAMRQADPGFTHSLESCLTNLNNYSNAEEFWAPCSLLSDRYEVYLQASDDIQRIFQRIAELTGRDPWQEQP